MTNEERATEIVRGSDACLDLREKDIQELIALIALALDEVEARGQGSEGRDKTPEELRAIIDETSGITDFIRGKSA